MGAAEGGGDGEVVGVAKGAATGDAVGVKHEQQDAAGFRSCPGVGERARRACVRCHACAITFSMLFQRSLPAQRGVRRRHWCLQVRRGVGGREVPPARFAPRPRGLRASGSCAVVVGWVCAAEHERWNVAHVRSQLQRALS